MRSAACRLATPLTMLLTQIVHELLQSAQRGGGSVSSASAAATAAMGPPACMLNVEDRDSIVAVAPDGLTCQARDEVAWGGIRGAVGARAGEQGAAGARLGRQQAAAQQQGCWASPAVHRQQH